MSNNLQRPPSWTLGVIISVFLLISTGLVLTSSVLDDFQYARVIKIVTAITVVIICILVIVATTKGAPAPSGGGHGGHGGSHGPPERGMIFNGTLNTIGFLIVFLPLCSVIFLFWWIYSSVDNITTELTNRRPVVTVSKTLYRFPKPMGCVEFTARNLGDIDFYPKGGEVEITPPQNAKPLVKPWKDKPGTDLDVGDLPKGDYKVCGTDKDAWGVEVWN
jgi:hypothetical protein